MANGQKQVANQSLICECRTMRLQQKVASAETHKVIQMTKLYDWFASKTRPAHTGPNKFPNAAPE